MPQACQSAVEALLGVCAVATYTIASAIERAISGPDVACKPRALWGLPLLRFSYAISPTHAGRSQARTPPPTSGRSVTALSPLSFVGSRWVCGVLRAHTHGVVVLLALPMPQELAVSWVRMRPLVRAGLGSKRMPTRGVQVCTYMAMGDALCFLAYPSRMSAAAHGAASAKKG